MRRALALAAAIALAGGAAIAQNTFIFWTLIRDPDAATLVSDRDYHAPEGIRLSFSCKAKSKKLTVREYLNRTDRVKPAIEFRKRDGRTVVQESCDAACARESDAAVREYIRDGGQLLALRPQRYAETVVNWNAPQEKLISSHLLDPAQFGDAGPASVQAGLTRQRELLASFKQACQLR
jgi:hypothetical protein